MKKIVTAKMQEKRKRILECALDLFAQKGYKWGVRKEISREEMTEMVLSFHHSLAVGLVADQQLIKQHSNQ